MSLLSSTLQKNTYEYEYKVYHNVCANYIISGWAKSGLVVRRNPISSLQKARDSVAVVVSVLVHFTFRMHQYQTNKLNERARTTNDCCYSM
jgi:hypothetical protein